MCVVVYPYVCAGMYVRLSRYFYMCICVYVLCVSAYDGCLHM